jgi:curved DNA-binding protein
MQDTRANYYDLLGIDRTSSASEIKQAYRKLARMYHPDRNLGDKAAEEKIKDVNEAYEVLSDLSRRKEYDRAMGFGNLRDLLGDFVGKRNKPQDPPTPPESTRRERPHRPPNPAVDREPAPPPPAAPRPKNLEAELTLPLNKAYLGGRERISIQEDGRYLEVDLPPGMVPGQKIRLKGQGIAGGDLFLKIEIAPHQFFILQDRDIYCQLPITPAEAVLGGEIEIPTLDGLVRITLPQGVVSGQKLRLAGKGFPTEDNRRGDQLLEIYIAIPKDLLPAEQELYQRLRQIETFNPRFDLPMV